ncbi:helix-turn-helix domain-containing protein [Ornithinimicrobium cavernae]|uniref:helix-turn-helix domain-containing protein n=1 Tax=Ornithinimicrobium cavernae TaxID=2666047 RepID=UPI000D693072|nr:cupin domain-containing protein [Ornithinimicrobium cavernae]
MIGSRLKRLRTANGMTLRALAERSGLSVTMLSQIERGVTEPSLRSLRTLAGVFGQSVAELFHDDAVPSVHVSRPGARSRIVSPQGRVQYERVSSSNGQLEVLRSTLEPGESSSDEPWAHEAVECVYVLTGELTVVVSEVSYTVGQGEAITIDSRHPHRYLNDSPTPVEFLLSVTPPTP